MKVTDELVNRFLNWPLPDSVCSDECVTKRDWGKERGWPKRVGTNLLTADEARQMLEHVLKRESNAAGWNEKGIADIGVLPGEVDATAEPAPAAPDVDDGLTVEQNSVGFVIKAANGNELFLTNERAAALLARLGQGWVPSARFSWGPGGMVADPKGGYVWVDIPKLCADCLQPEYCGRNGCIQPAPGASDE